MSLPQNNEDDHKAKTSYLLENNNEEGEVVETQNANHGIDSICNVSAINLYYTVATTSMDGNPNEDVIIDDIEASNKVVIQDYTNRNPIVDGSKNVSDTSVQGTNMVIGIVNVTVHDI